jgi:hypothetical protein
MVISPKSNHAWLVAELMVAVSILAIASIPLAFSFRSEQRLVRAHYQKVVAMEIIDGEMEVLRAGQWRAWLDGEHDYPITAHAKSNLPSGKFLLTRSNQHLRLEWLPAKKGQGGHLVRETLIPPP